MKNLIKTTSIFFITIFFLNGCSSSLPEVKITEKIAEGIYTDNLRINVKQIYAWVNLMPGVKGRFHLTGSLELLEDSKYELKNVTIKNITILQNKVNIYQFTPKIEEKIEQDKKTIIFSTIKGLLLTSILDREKGIDVEILISDSSNELIYIIPNVEIFEVR